MLKVENYQHDITVESFVEKLYTIYQQIKNVERCGKLKIMLINIMTLLFYDVECGKLPKNCL